MEGNRIDISIHGKWTNVPALELDGAIIAVTGKWLKMAVVHDEEYAETELADPQRCIRRLREQGSPELRADVFTFAQKIPATIPRYSYATEFESLAVVRTTSFKQWWDSLPQETRKNVRRSQKRGVVVHVKQLNDDLIRGIVDVNNDSSVRQGKAFVHYGKNLDQVRKDQAAFADRSDYVCAYFEDELVGFMKIVYRGDVASMVQILPKASHQDKRVGNALIAKGVEHCEAKGISYLTYGKFKYGNRQESSLQEFKVRNGFEEMLVPRFFVPLTAWGKICIRLKLYRGLIGLLPDSLMKVGVNARTKWYDIVALVRKPA